MEDIVVLIDTWDERTKLTAKTGRPYSQDGTALPVAHWLIWSWSMARYFFDIKDGHRLVDPSGFDCKNDEAAIEKARVLAIGVSLDKPAVDPERHIAVLNADRVEIFKMPVYSKPAAA